MFSTSIDVLNLVLTVCILFLTFFLCWAIYYFISLACTIKRITKKVEMGVNKAEEVVDMARQKLSNSSVYFSIIGELAKKAMEFAKEKKESKRAGKNKKK